MEAENKDGRAGRSNEARSAGGGLEADRNFQRNEFDFSHIRNEWRNLTCSQDGVGLFFLLIPDL